MSESPQSNLRSYYALPGPPDTPPWGMSPGQRARRQRDPLLDLRPDPEADFYLGEGNPLSITSFVADTTFDAGATARRPGPDQQGPSERAAPASEPNPLPSPLFNAGTGAAGEDDPLDLSGPSQEQLLVEWFGASGLNATQLSRHLGVREPRRKRPRPMPTRAAVAVPKAELPIGSVAEHPRHRPVGRPAGVGDAPATHPAPDPIYHQLPSSPGNLHPLWPKPAPGVVDLAAASPESDVVSFDGPPSEDDALPPSWDTFAHPLRTAAAEEPPALRDASSRSPARLSSAPAPAASPPPAGPGAGASSPAILHAAQMPHTEARRHVPTPVDGVARVNGSSDRTGLSSSLLGLGSASDEGMPLPTTTSSRLAQPLDPLAASRPMAPATRPLSTDGHRTLSSLIAPASPPSVREATPPPAPADPAPALADISTIPLEHDVFELDFALPDEPSPPVGSPSTGAAHWSMSSSNASAHAVEASAAMGNHDTQPDRRPWTAHPAPVGASSARWPPSRPSTSPALGTAASNGNASLASLAANHWHLGAHSRPVSRADGAATGLGNAAPVDPFQHLPKRHLSSRGSFSDLAALRSRLQARSVQRPRSAPGGPPGGGSTPVAGRAVLIGARRLASGPPGAGDLADVAIRSPRVRQLLQSVGTIVPGDGGAPAAGPARPHTAPAPAAPAPAPAPAPDPPFFLSSATSGASLRPGAERPASASASAPASASSASISPMLGSGPVAAASSMSLADPLPASAPVSTQASAPIRSPAPRPASFLTIGSVRSDGGQATPLAPGSPSSTGSATRSRLLQQALSSGSPRRRAL
ncbi:hypothetical protein H696_04997 [Fonticula alba]|uniref:Uncharacterized protein n=1 Tax=Fonticula alba TaxID=691883 RepID=A0A058Z335_FONAL|nr:hypothetical protein H696_04997 [Fonticula alba]KCV68709.1 hypothetical protein H696_04997 [Fonticula alba]|eukprot:XP_009497141.1 hypothetical protein H696_04997 [Fonticula alba]